MPSKKRSKKKQEETEEMPGPPPPPPKSNKETSGPPPPPPHKSDKETPGPPPKSNKDDNTLISVEEEGDEESVFVLSDEIKKIKNGEEPKCCGCLNMCMASFLMGLFYLLPIIPYAFHFYALKEMHAVVFGKFTLFAVMCGVTAILSFYNACSPQTWCSEWIGYVQIALFIVLSIISICSLTVAILQANNWSYYEAIENCVDDAFKKFSSAVLASEVQEETKGKTAYYFCLVLGILSFILGMTSMYIASTFREMSDHIFDQQIFEDYQALKALENKKMGPKRRNAKAHNSKIPPGKRKVKAPNSKIPPGKRKVKSPNSKTASGRRKVKPSAPKK